MPINTPSQVELGILVVGGAGYIGSHLTRMLCDYGYRVLVLDNLQSGYRNAVTEKAEFIYGDMADSILLSKIFNENEIHCVVHLASEIQVGESVINPIKYYQNNVVKTLVLLEQMVVHGVARLVFSSSAAIFGNPQYTPIDELHPKVPLSPYGKSKLFIEQALLDYEKAYQLRAVSLRYFNAAGSHTDGSLGERHKPETHLIPLVLQAASGRRSDVTVFGNDYPTPDGTCIRDYIHILDLCSAHILAIRYLESEVTSAAFNLGNGSGYSVYEVIETACRVTGIDIQVVYSKRRNGDPAILVSDSKMAISRLGWIAKYNDLETIIEHAWKWEKNAHQWA